MAGFLFLSKCSFVQTVTVTYTIHLLCMEYQLLYCGENISLTSYHVTGHGANLECVAIQMKATEQTEQYFHVYIIMWLSF